MWTWMPKTIEVAKRHPECIVSRPAAELGILLLRVNNVNAFATDGKASIHLAICNDNVPAFDALMATGADFRKTIEKGLTILHAAACSASVPTIIASSEIDGLSLNAQQVNLAGFSAFDVLDSNPSDPPHLRTAFTQLAVKVAEASSQNVLDMDCETEDVFQGAVSYQRAS